MLRMGTALIAALVLAGCGGSSSTSGNAAPGAGKPRITLGTKNFSEAVLLGELYAQALEAKGFKVDLKPDIGATEVVDRALTNGTIDLYPEYTGVILSVVKRQPVPPKTERETYDQARAFEAHRGFDLLEPTPFENRDAIAVTKRFARDNHGISSLGDLKRLGSTVVLSGAPEFRTRFAGLLGLRAEYGLEQLKYKALPIGEGYPALDSGKVQAAAVFTTDGQLASGRYQLLDDPKAIFGFQHVVPVVSRKVLEEEGSAFAATLDAVSAKLTNAAMQRLNKAVALDKQDPAAVAKVFLRTSGLT